MDKKEVRFIDWVSGLLLGIIGMIFFVAFLGVDAYMFDLNPPSWTRPIDNLIFLQPFWLDALSTVMLIGLIILVYLHPSKQHRRRS